MPPVLAIVLGALAAVATTLVVAWWLHRRRLVREATDILGRLWTAERDLLRLAPDVNAAATTFHRAKLTRELGQPHDAVGPARALIAAYRLARRVGATPLACLSRY